MTAVNVWPIGMLLDSREERAGAEGKHEVEAMLAAAVRAGVPPPFTRPAPPLLVTQPGTLPWCSLLLQHTGLEYCKAHRLLFARDFLRT